MATFLIGYDVEDPDPLITRAFLKRAVTVHEKLQAPATLFVVGQTLERSPEAFRNIAGHPLFDIQQHTYSHVRLKTVCQESDDGIQLFPGGTLAEIREEVAKASALLQEMLGLACIGLTGPWGYYRGLSDRPDILEILWDCGIRYARTYARDAHDWQPVPFEVQPFGYEAQGFPDLLEMPDQGWQDCLLRESLGWANLDGYLQAVEPNLDEIARRDLVWSYGQHDWSSVREDPSMHMTEALLHAAKERGIDIVHYTTFYHRWCTQRPSMPREMPSALAAGSPPAR